jgi:hypothetical protein
MKYPVRNADQFVPWLRKIKFGPRTGLDGPEAESWYNSTLSFTLALDGVGQHHAPADLPPGKRPGTHCTGGWVGHGPVWTGAENLAPPPPSPPGFDPRTVQPAASRYTD